jgi:tRNA U38,U39,U40 pseudouridine synthase TruA
VARGSLTEEDFEALLARPGRGRRAPTAPAHGLTLVKVAYREGE